MLTFHNDPSIKAKYLARVKAHQEADEIIQGHYWQKGKGCAVGCTIEGDNHRKYKTELGVPENIAYLEDRLFELMSNEDAKLFPYKFLDIIPVGVDLEKNNIIPKFLHWLLVDEQYGVINFANTDDSKNAVLNVADLLHKKINGKRVTKKQWIAAAAAAAARAAVARAAAAHAAAAAYAAADYDSADATIYAVYAAADAYADARAAKHKHAAIMADKLLQLLREAK